MGGFFQQLKSVVTGGELRILLLWLLTVAVTGVLLTAIRSHSPRVAALCRRLCRPWNRWTAALSARPARGYAAIGALFLTANLLMALVLVPPTPGVHDEFSYVLAGDTFAHGRLTNPPHPLWEHFETLHVLHEPTYMSKYLPAQGLFLALGQRLTGWQITGVWLIGMLGCWAIFWALRSVLPLRWAVLGGLGAALHPVLTGWAQSFWGGGVAMTGGALVLGAVLRLAPPFARREPSPMVLRKAGLALGVGLSLLLLSRPYEGGTFALLCIAWGIVLLRRSPLTRQGYFPRLFRAAALPIALPFLIAAGFLLIFNRAVTGSFVRLPYMQYTQNVDQMPIFVWEKPLPPKTYRIDIVREYSESMLAARLREYTDFSTAFATLRRKLATCTLVPYEVAYLSIGTLALLLALLRGRVRGKTVIALEGLAFLTVFIVVVMLGNFMTAHYAAPGVGLMFLVGLSGLRLIAVTHRRQGARNLRVIAPIIVPVLIAVAFLLYCAVVFAKYRFVKTEKWKYERVAITQRLSANGKKAMVLVRYILPHYIGEHWVYNPSDIDAAPVIWANDLGDAKNQRLLEYYRDREIYLLTTGDKSPTNLVPYRSGL